MVDLFTVNIMVWQSSTGIVTFLAWLTCYVNLLSFYMTRAFTILSYCNKIPTTTYIYKTVHTEAILARYSNKYSFAIKHKIRQLRTFINTVNTEATIARYSNRYSFAIKHK